MRIAIIREDKFLTMRINMQDDRYFRSQDFYLATFLFAKGLELVNVDKITNPKRATFIFIDTPEREAFVRTFNYAKENSPDVKVDARKLLAATKALKGKLYQDNF